MNYISIRETALKWGVTERRVQDLCKTGAIEGATRFGRAWMIPEDAPKPVDGRTKQIKQEKMSVKYIPMPLLNTSFKAGHCMESIVSIEDTDLRNIALCEYYYFSGQADKASCIAEEYLTNDDIALRLSACWIFAYANLALNRISYTRKAMAFVKDAFAAVDENTPKETRALAVFISTAASVLLHLPLPEDMPALMQFIHLLPTGLRLFALYVQAHHMYLNKEYWASIGVIETALALQGETYPIPTIYLHLVATMNYMALKRPEQAKKHLLSAWETAQPDDLIEAFGEHHGLLGGMLEAVMKKEWPVDFKRIISITYNFSAGWRKIHNVDTGNDIADDLTTTEFAVAMLASRGWSNKEIGAHMGVSANTVKQHLSVVFQKLAIEQRKELANFMLK